MKPSPWFIWDLHEGIIFAKKIVNAEKFLHKFVQMLHNYC